jgi:hypothetical protein
MITRHLRKRECSGDSGKAGQMHVRGGNLQFEHVDLFFFAAGECFRSSSVAFMTSSTMREWWVSDKMLGVGGRGSFLIKVQDNKIIETCLIPYMYTFVFQQHLF